MARFTFICVGKTKLKEIQELEAFYLKRIKRYQNFQIIQTKDFSHPDPQIKKEKEAVFIQKNLIQPAFTLLLDEKGKSYTSQDFATYLESLNLDAHKNIQFILGGAYGVSAEIKDLCQAQISLSKMTFAHDLCRVIFLEQFYRAQTILKGEPYHH